MDTVGSGTRVTILRSRELGGKYVYSPDDGLCLAYLTALTGDKRASSAAPFGGTAFILGWLALAFAATRRGGAASMLKGK
jgi:hypothetical protein